MKFTLQELLEQKALLEKHLELIDSRIDQIQGKSGLTEPEPVPAALVSDAEKHAPPEKSFSEKSLLSTPPPIIQQPKESPPVEAETDQPAPVVPDIDIQTYGRQTTPADARKGCLLWAGLIVGLGTIIFILFYMFYPNWDEDKAREKLKDQPQEEKRIGP